MKNKYVIWTVVVIIVLVLIFFFGFYHAPVTSENPNSLENASSSSIIQSITSNVSRVASEQTLTSGTTVVYGNSGFSPKTLQITRGTSVHFVNHSSKTLLIVANDGSPITDNINQPKPIGPSGVYVVDFSYAGVWNYHNASLPSDTGNIVVY